jgi:ferredoxin-type protein NapH
MRRMRWALQIAGLALANIGLVEFLKVGVCAPFFYCHSCPAAAFACPIGLLQTHTALGPFPFYALGILGVFGLAAGRFWCGWVCPFGTVQDLVHRIKGGRDSVDLPRTPWTKFLVLGIALLLAWLFADLMFCKICPAGSLFAAIPQRFASPELNFGSFFYVHVATLAIALAAFFLISRVWCRYLCPLGAVLGAFNRLSIMKVRVDFARCTDCKQCLKVCPMKITQPEDIENSTDCTRCGRCVEACDAGALRISASFRD